MVVIRRIAVKVTFNAKRMKCGRIPAICLKSGLEKMRSPYLGDCSEK
jgi:hypothetical protein